MTELSVTEEAKIVGMKSPVVNQRASNPANRRPSVCNCIDRTHQVINSIHKEIAGGSSKDCNTQAGCNFE